MKGGKSMLINYSNNLLYCNNLCSQYQCYKSGHLKAMKQKLFQVEQHVQYLSQLVRNKKKMLGTATHR